MVVRELVRVGREAKKQHSHTTDLTAWVLLICRPLVCRQRPSNDRALDGNTILKMEPVVRQRGLGWVSNMIKNLYDEESVAMSCSMCYAPH